MMTPTRLRAIAARVEQVCIETRKLRSGATTACAECVCAAQDLRTMAEEMGPKGKLSGSACAEPLSSALPDQNGPAPEGQPSL